MLIPDEMKKEKKISTVLLLLLQKIKLEVTENIFFSLIFGPKLRI